MGKRRIEEVEPESDLQTKSGKYHVKCHPPTPLAYTEVDIVAESPEAARAEFFKMNGISGTVHEVTIEQSI
jgi:hypothetical protein